MAILRSSYPALWASKQEKKERKKARTYMETRGGGAERDIHIHTPHTPSPSLRFCSLSGRVISTVTSGECKPRLGQLKKSWSSDHHLVHVPIPKGSAADCHCAMLGECFPDEASRRVPATPRGAEISIGRVSWRLQIQLKGA